MRTVFYSSLEEKQKLKREALNNGESVIHDDFLTPGGTKGKLTLSILEPITEEKKQMSRRDFINMLAEREEVELS